MITSAKREMPYATTWIVELPEPFKDLGEVADPSVFRAAIEARRLIMLLADRLSTEHMPMPYLDAGGDEFAMAFDRWIVRLVDWLRAPTRE